MNLTIDTGNTRTKFAVFDGETIVASGILENTEQYAALFGQYPIEAVIASSVGQDIDFQSITPQDTHFYTLDAELTLPIVIDYETPETLGPDRIAACVGASALFPMQNCLVIDAGTCITVDLIDINGIFDGIAILPGLTMKFEALHTFTKKLPLLHLSDVNELDRKGSGSTRKSILSGVYAATLLELYGFYDMYKIDHEDLKAVLTGGDGLLLEQDLKDDSIDTTYVKDLTLIGLNKILEYNENQNK
jgi:type III pantothenate kinase